MNHALAALRKIADELDKIVGTRARPSGTQIAWLHKTAKDGVKRAEEAEKEKRS